MDAESREDYECVAPKTGKDEESHNIASFVAALNVPTAARDTRAVSSTRDSDRETRELLTFKYDPLYPSGLTSRTGASARGDGGKGGGGGPTESGRASSGEKFSASGDVVLPKNIEDYIKLLADKRPSGRPDTGSAMGDGHLAKGRDELTKMLAAKPAADSRGLGKALDAVARKLDRIDRPVELSYEKAADLLKSIVSRDFKAVAKNLSEVSARYPSREVGAVKVAEHIENANRVLKELGVRARLAEDPKQGLCVMIPSGKSTYDAYTIPTSPKEVPAHFRVRETMVPGSDKPWDSSLRSELKFERVAETPRESAAGLNAACKTLAGELLRATTTRRIRR